MSEDQTDAGTARGMEGSGDEQDEACYHYHFPRGHIDVPIEEPIERRALGAIVDSVRFQYPGRGEPDIEDLVGIQQTLLQSHREDMLYVQTYLPDGSSDQRTATDFFRPKVLAVWAFTRQSWDVCLGIAVTNGESESYVVYSSTPNVESVVWISYRLLGDGQEEWYGMTSDPEHQRDDGLFGKIFPPEAGAVGQIGPHQARIVPNRERNGFRNALQAFIDSMRDQRTDLPMPTMDQLERILQSQAHWSQHLVPDLEIQDRHTLSASNLFLVLSRWAIRYAGKHLRLGVLFGKKLRLVSNPGLDAGVVYVYCHIDTEEQRVRWSGMGHSIPASPSPGPSHSQTAQVQQGGIQSKGIQPKGAAPTRPSSRSPPHPPPPVSRSSSPLSSPPTTLSSPVSPPRPAPARITKRPSSKRRPRGRRPPPAQVPRRQLPDRAARRGEKRYK